MAKQSIQTNLLGQRVEVVWNDFSGEPTDINQSDYGTIRSVFLIDGRPWYTVELEGLGNESIGTLKDFPQDRVIVNCLLRQEYNRITCENVMPNGEDIISKRRKLEAEIEEAQKRGRIPPDACLAKDGKGISVVSCRTKNCDSCTHVPVGNDRCVARKGYPELRAETL